MSETKYTAAVITISDKGFRGEREDTSGPALCEMLKEQGWDVVYTALVPDEKELIQKELLLCADEKRVALARLLQAVAVLALIVAVAARLLAGVHWVTDIAAGCLVSLAITFFYNALVTE